MHDVFYTSHNVLVPPTCPSPKDTGQRDSSVRRAASSGNPSLLRLAECPNAWHLLAAHCSDRDMFDTANPVASRDSMMVNSPVYGDET
jgi:hypothetical protein